MKTVIEMCIQINMKIATEMTALIKAQDISLEKDLDLEKDISQVTLHWKTLAIVDLHQVQDQNLALFLALVQLKTELVVTHVRNMIIC